MRLSGSGWLGVPGTNDHDRVAGTDKWRILFTVANGNRSSHGVRLRGGVNAASDNATAGRSSPLHMLRSRAQSRVEEGGGARLPYAGQRPRRPDACGGDQSIKALKADAS